MQPAYGQDTPDPYSDPGMLERAVKAVHALGQRDPIREVPDYYLDPSQMPRETFGAQALKNVSRAFSAAAPPPVHVPGIAGTPGMDLDASGGLGGIGPTYAAISMEEFPEALRALARRVVPRESTPLFQGRYDGRPPGEWWARDPESAIGYAQKGGDNGVVHITGSRDVLDPTLEELRTGKQLPSEHAEALEHSLNKPNSGPGGGVGVSKKIRASDLTPDSFEKLFSWDGLKSLIPDALKNESGAVGKYELANKFGDGLIEAAREFQPLVKERRLLKKSNAAALANGVPPGLGPRPAQDLLQIIPSDIDLSGFSKSELEELTNRAWHDKGTAYQDPRYELNHTPFSDLESRIRQRSDQLAELDALNKKPGVRKLYDPMISRDLDRAAYWNMGDDDVGKLIKRLQQENDSLPGNKK